MNTCLCFAPDTLKCINLYVLHTMVDVGLTHLAYIMSYNLRFYGKQQGPFRRTLYNTWCNLLLHTICVSTLYVTDYSLCNARCMFLPVYMLCFTCYALYRRYCRICTNTICLLLDSIFYIVHMYVFAFLCIFLSYRKDYAYYVIYYVLHIGYFTQLCMR